MNTFNNGASDTEMTDLEIELVSGGIADPDDIYPDYMFRLVGPTVCRVYEDPGFLV